MWGLDYLLGFTFNVVPPLPVGTSCLSLAFKFLILSCSWATIFWSETMEPFLGYRWLAYSTTCAVRDIGTSNVIDYRPVVCHELGKVVKGLFNTHQVIGSIAVLSHRVLALAETRVRFDKVVLKCHPHIYSSARHTQQSSWYFQVLDMSTYVMRTSWVLVTGLSTAAEKLLHSLSL